MIQTTTRGNSRRQLSVLLLVMALAFAALAAGCSGQESKMQKPRAASPAAPQEAPEEAKSAPAPAPAPTSPAPFTIITKAPESPEPPPTPKLKPHHGAKTPPETGQFPWPPPQASSTCDLPNSSFLKENQKSAKFSEVDQKIRNALNSLGYYEWSYYSIPKGFALVTHVERFKDDGSSMSEAERWSLTAGPPKSFSLSSYLKALFTCPPGLYRVIVFAVTLEAFKQEDSQTSMEEASEWLEHGLNKLPPALGKMAYTNEHSCTVLVYEFEKASGQQKPVIRYDGLSARVHLDKSGIWGALNK